MKNPARTFEAELKAHLLYELVDKFVYRVPTRGLIYEGRCGGSQTECPPLDLIRKISRDTIRPDMRQGWRNAEFCFMRPDSLYGYITEPMPVDDVPERVAENGIYWYPYTADEQGVKKANEAYLITFLELLAHDSAERCALADVGVPPAQDDDTLNAWWDHLMEHPLWPHDNREKDVEFSLVLADGRRFDFNIAF